jgi:hypothetical protein
MYHRDISAPPSTEELQMLGFEEVQILLIRKLEPIIQWLVCDEQIHRLMNDQSTDGVYF